MNVQKYEKSKISIEKLSICFRYIERRLSPAEKITLRGRALRVILKILIEKLSICWRHIERRLSPAEKITLRGRALRVITLRDRALRVNLDSTSHFNQKVRRGAELSLALQRRRITF